MGVGGATGAGRQMGQDVMTRMRGAAPAAAQAAPAAAQAAPRYGRDVMGNASTGLLDSFRTYMGVAGANAPQVGAAPSIASRMDMYQNPYEDQVVNRTRNNMMRTMDQNLDQVGAAATAAGAFGGGRHGLVEATTRAEGMRDIGDMTAQMRSQGFNTAAGLAGQDIGNIMAARTTNAQLRGQQLDRRMTAAGGLADNSRQAFEMGTNLMDRQTQSGQMAQQMQQAIMDAGAGMFGDYTAQPEKLLELRLKSLGMNPLTSATTSTQTSNPGWGAMFGNLLGAAGNMFSFSPITLSARRFKDDIQKTGRLVRSKSGKLAPEVTFRYKPVTGMPEGVYTGIIAEDLGNDPAVIRDNAGRAQLVDYSQLEVVK